MKKGLKVLDKIEINFDFIAILKSVVLRFCYFMQG